MERRNPRPRRYHPTNESGRANELYVREGNQSGSELDEWLQAEEEIRSVQEEAIEKD